MLLFKTNRENAIKYLDNIKSVIPYPTRLFKQYISSPLYKKYIE